MPNQLLTPTLSTPEIYRDLHTQLVTGQIIQGTKLRSQELRDVYKCSATTIREVLFRLTSVELVDFQEQRGFRAKPVEAERQHYLTKFRITLEQEGATASIENGGLEWEAELSAAHHKLSHIEKQFPETLQNPVNLRLWSFAEWEFHDTLLSSCDSPFLRLTYKRIYNQFRQQKITQENFGYHPENAAEHQAIVTAALDRDAAGCRLAIYNHMKRNLRDSDATGKLHPDRQKAG